MSENCDPYQSEEYAKFVDSMLKYCHCCRGNRPCDGVLAGGVCDGVKEDDFYDAAENGDEQGDW